MKHHIFILLAVILVLVLVVSGCAAPTPAPKPAPVAPTATAPAPVASPSPVAKPAPSPAPSPAPALKPAPAPSAPMKLRYALQSTSTSWSAIHATLPWMKKVEEATKGKVQFEVYWANTLCKATDTWSALQYGIADSALVVHGNFPNLTPLSDVMSLPFLGFKTAEQASAVFWQLYDKFPSVRDEYKINRPLLLFTSTPYFIINSKKEIKTLADIKGMKMRVLGGPPTETMKALGGIPMLVTMADTYINLQKGVVDGMTASWESIYSFRNFEVVKYYTYVPLDCAYFSVTMSKDTWNRLSPDIQKEIEKLSGIDGSRFWGYNYHDTPADAVRDEVKKKGFPMIEYTLPLDEVDKWKKVAGEPIWDGWVKKMAAAGKPEAKEILNAALDLGKSTK